MTKGISETPDGLLVRVYRQGRAISRFVPWGQHANKESAMAAAEVELEELVRQHPAPPRLPYPRPSISYTYSRGDGGSGMRMFTYQVTYWTGPKAKHTKDFWVHKYDDPQDAERAAKTFAAKHEPTPVPDDAKGNST